MSHNFLDRLRQLQQATDDKLAGRLSFRPTLFKIFFLMSLASWVLSFFSFTAPEENPNPKIDPWLIKTNAQYQDRSDWLERNILSPLGSYLYQEYSHSVVESLPQELKTTVKPGDIVDLGSVSFYWAKLKTGISLRLGFIFIAFLPLWVISFLVGLFAFKKRFRSKPSEDFLGICDRGRTPFYSGIHGPLNTNNNLSATELAVPSLACPNLAAESQALAHPLTALLKAQGAFNKTNFELTRIILNYRDFPSFVESEQSIEEQQPENPAEQPLGDEQLTISKTFITNEAGTIEKSSVEGLQSILAVHRTLVESLPGDRQFKDRISQTAFYREVLTKRASKLNALGKNLLLALTPARSLAIARLSPAMLATAYLSIEAGKCLVYQREGKQFSRLSRFPHLQARAILHSVLPYFKEYQGQERLLIRQAIVCSRRHGDFGRAFLPTRMSIESRALRDWLEIMYAPEPRREITGRLVELDGHIEEIHNNWRNNYVKRLRQGLEPNLLSSPNSNRGDEIFWRGIPYKSVVLIPLPELLKLALGGIDEVLIKRLTDLLGQTRRYQSSLSISARLPGFKRQASEADDTAELLSKGSSDKALIDRWVIVRRMLTKYNWLSTRVGDNAVPSDGIIHAVIAHHLQNSSEPEVFSFDHIVPVRQRRHEEILGSQWESVHFADSPHNKLIRIFTDLEAYRLGKEDAKKYLRMKAQANRPDAVAAAG